MAVYREEIQRRRLSETLPEGTQFLVVPDPGDERVGSGGATINALGVPGKDRGMVEEALGFTRTLRR